MTISIKSPTSTTGSIQKNGSDVITIDASDNVTVANDLTVSGTISGTGTSQWSTSGSNISYTTGNVGIGKDTLLSFYPTDQSYANIKFEWDTGDAGYLHSTAYNGMKWTANGSERMRIDSSGSLLVGTTTAQSGFNMVLQHGSSGAGAGLATVTTTTGAVNAISFQNPNGQIGRVQVNLTTTTYVTSSDYRLKENIVPMTGALDKVALLKPVTYTWKTDGTNGQGFIAHELQEFYPEAIAGTKDEVDEDGKPVHQGVDTSFLVATLTAAIQEQQALITSLTARITALEGA